MSAEAPIPPAEVVSSKRDSTLRYLEFLRLEITGSRGFAPLVGADFPTRTIDSILEGLAVEAYHHVLSKEWRIVPKRFFRTDSVPE
jgi:hypothetical protein